MTDQCEACHAAAGERPIVSTRIDPATGARTAVVRCRACDLATATSVALGGRAAGVNASRRRGTAASRTRAR